MNHPGLKFVSCHLASACIPTEVGVSLPFLGAGLSQTTEFLENSWFYQAKMAS